MVTCGGRMKNKKLLAWNVVFYAIQYSVSLFYIGYEYGEGSLFPHPRGIEYIILPAVCLVFLFFGIHFVQNHEYVTPKSYYTMAVVTLLFSGSLWGCWLFFYFQGKMTSASIMDIVIYPGSMLAFAVIIFVLYLICAVRTKKNTSNI